MHRQKVLDQGTFYPVVTIAKAVEAFLTDCHIRQISPKTMEFYTKKLKRFLAFCEGQAITRLDQVEVGLLRQFFLWLEENGNNAGGRHAYFRTLRAWFNWLVEEYEGYISPLQKLKPPKVDNPPIPGVSLAEVQALLKTCHGKTFTDIRDKALILVLLDTGMRIGECLAMDWEDVDLVGGAILIRKGKNRKPRMVFLGRTARQALRAYAHMCQDSPHRVWITVQGDPLAYDGVRDMLRRRAKRAGLKDVPTPHDFRRACALTLLRNGADVVSVSRLLGHSSLEVTQRYLAQTENDLHHTHRRFSPADSLPGRTK